jgi:hypothetical protein
MEAGGRRGGDCEKKERRETLFLPPERSYTNRGIIYKGYCANVESFRTDVET